jgi:hypothetical protein
VGIRSAKFVGSAQRAVRTAKRGGLRRVMPAGSCHFLSLAWTQVRSWMIKTSSSLIWRTNPTLWVILSLRPSVRRSRSAPVSSNQNLLGVIGNIKH